MWWSLGYVEVTTSGSPVRATVNAPDPAELLPSHSVLFQQVSGNTGKVYVCSGSSADKDTGEGVVAVLATPSTNVLPSAAVTITNALNAINVADFWLDADTSGDKVLVSYVQA